MAHILLLHASRDIRNHWAGIAESEGHLVRECTDIEEARQTLTKHTTARPCPVMIAGSKEIAQPQGDTAAGIIELKKAAPGLSMILVASNPTVDEIAVCIRAGAVDYLADSADANELRRSLNAAVNRAATEELNRTLEGEHRLYQEHLESLIERQTADLRAILTRLISIRDSSREALSAELHDHIGQDLLALKLQLQSLAESRNEAPAFADCTTRIDQLARAVRTISHRLSPLLVQSAGILTALQLLCDKCVSETGIRLRLDIESLGTLAAGDEVQTAIHRFIEEALSNLRRHSGANEGILTARVLPPEVEITISDNGKGFDPSQCEEGLGLLLLREYASRLNGTHTIESAPGRGTLVTLHIPRKTFT